VPKLLQLDKPVDSSSKTKDSSTMPILIRNAHRDDLPELARMNQALIEDEGSRNPMTLSQLQHRMEGWLQGDWTIRIFVDAISTQTVGYAVFQNRPDDYFPEQSIVTLRQMFIDRPFRGQGTGQQAVEQLREACFPPNSTVVIDVLSTNPRGRRFWDKLGFQPYCTTMHLPPKS
jgi:GNAT superfamily N-acetyltransferase